MFSYTAEFEVISCTLLPDDSSAVMYPRMDADGRQCAIIKVKTGLKGIEFEANSGITGDIEYKSDEYWLYVSPDEKLLDISRGGFENLAFVLEEEIQPASVYLLILEIKNNRKDETAAPISVEEKKKVYYKDQSECNGYFIDQRDGQKYEIVKIGEQCWMAENLNYKVKGSWCYAERPISCEKYGSLYEWKLLMNNEESSDLAPSGVQGLCPDGWHIPSDREWIMLEKSVDSNKGIPDFVWESDGQRGTDAGFKLKSKHFWASDLAGNDELGFSSLPGGYRSFAVYRNLQHRAFYWSSTESKRSKAWCRTNDRHPGLSKDDSNKGFSYSVRCLRD